MSEDQLQENSTVKNISFGIEGILLGLFLFILVLLALNYFRIISLSFLYPTLSILPQKEQLVVQNVSITTKTLPISKDTLTVEEKAEKAGYEIAWKGPTEDGSGRAILASEERSINGWVDKFGWIYTNEYDLKNPDLFRGIFIFKEWEKITDSSDYYAIMTDPKDNNKEYKVRILLDKTYLSSAVHYRLNEFDNLGGNRTRLEVENLYYGNLNLKIKHAERIGFFYELTEEKINRVIRPGDIITVFTIPVSRAEAEQSNYQVRRDKANNPVIISFIIRRFDGKEDIQYNN